MTTWGFSWFLRGVMNGIRPTLDQGAHVYVFTDWRQQPNVYGLLEATGYRVNHSLVWDKEHFGMGAYWRNQHEHIVFASWGTPQPMRNKGMGSVLRCRGVLPAARLHPTEKPVKLLRSILEAAPDGLVFDPFGGSGPTARAAKDAGRRAVICEIEERYCEIAARRLQQSVLPLEVA
jgi:site-specific DNA-methyltransferase (adenine-specific)